MSDSRSFFKIELVEIVGDLQSRLTGKDIHISSSDSN